MHHQSTYVGWAIFFIVSSRALSFRYFGNILQQSDEEECNKLICSIYVCSASYRILHCIWNAICKFCEAMNTKNNGDHNLIQMQRSFSWNRIDLKSKYQHHHHLFVCLFVSVFVRSFVRLLCDFYGVWLQSLLFKRNELYPTSSRQLVHFIVYVA